MADESKAAAETEFDVIVLGAGSGGMGFGRRAASYGKKVAIIEKARLGGTCVNVGCVPKKLMWSTASVAEALHTAKHFGYGGVGEEFTFDWAAVKARRDAYVERLNGIYARNLGRDEVTLIVGDAAFSSPKTVVVNGVEYTAKEHINIAVGGRPRLPTIPGAEHVITSDGFFELETQPKNICIVGGGYIAVELAGVLAALGTKATVIARSGVLKRFDPLIRSRLAKEMEKNGIDVRSGCVPKRVEKQEDGLHVFLPCADGEGVDTDLGPFETVLYAIGRDVNTETIGLDKAGVKTRGNGTIIVDEYSNTNVDGISAVGDVIGSGYDLTPVAIAAGRLLADRLFNGVTDAKLDYDTIPTVVFSHPPIGTIGLTEPQAVARYGEENVKCWASQFPPMHYAVMDVEREKKPFCALKLIVAGEEQRVVGLHTMGYGADEAMQGFGIAMKMGATKADFDSCVAIHPIVMEDLVTLKPWKPYGPRAADLAVAAAAKAAEKK